MAEKIPPKDHESNKGNANKSTSGTNKQSDQGQGNRGKQMEDKKTPASGVKTSDKK